MAIATLSISSQKGPQPHVGEGERILITEGFLARALSACLFFWPHTRNFIAAPARPRGQGSPTQCWRVLPFQ